MSYGDDYQRARRQTEIDNFKTARHVTWTTIVALGMLIAIVFGSAAGCKSYNRYQSREDTKNATVNSKVKANNQVKLNEIMISTQKQRVLIEQQKAQIRFEKAQGIRKAQDEIAKTLTPLYVQFEMTEALKEIALSGKNSSVIYIPTGKDGLPVTAVEGKR